MNKRRNLRTPLLLTGEMTVGACTASVETRDISLGGARILNPPRAIEGAKTCFLTLFAEGSNEMPVSITLYGDIVDSDADSCAIRFAEVDACDFGQLTDLLSRHSGKAATLRDEVEAGCTPAMHEWGFSPGSAVA